MSIAAYYTEDLPQFSLKLELSIVPISRGFQATINYNVTMFAVDGDLNTPIPGGENMLPPEVVQAAKLKLWEKIRP